MNWNVITAAFFALPIAAVIGTGLNRLPILRRAYGEIERVYPDVIVLLYGLLLIIAALGAASAYLYFQQEGETDLEKQSAEKSMEYHLYAKVEAELKAKMKSSREQLAEQRRVVDEKSEELRTQLDAIKIERFENMVKTADAIKMNSDASTMLVKATAAAKAAEAILGDVDRVRGVYEQLSQILAKATLDPATATHVDPVRMEKQIKKVQTALQRCFDYWEQMDTMRFGKVVEHKEPQ